MKFTRRPNENWIYIEVMDEDGSGQDAPGGSNDDTIGSAKLNIMNILNNRQYGQV